MGILLQPSTTRASRSIRRQNNAVKSRDHSNNCEIIEREWKGERFREWVINRRKRKKRDREEKGTCTKRHKYSTPPSSNAATLLIQKRETRREREKRWLHREKEERKTDGGGGKIFKDTTTRTLTLRNLIINRQVNFGRHNFYCSSLALFFKHFITSEGVPENGRNDDWNMWVNHINFFLKKEREL